MFRGFLWSEREYLVHFNRQNFILPVGPVSLTTLLAIAQAGHQLGGYPIVLLAGRE